MKVVIVGGVAGGAATATRLRRLSEEASIVVFERGPHISYVNCGLPYYVGDLITDRADLLAATPEGLARRYRIDVRVRSEVEAIDRNHKTVRVRDLESGRAYDEPYDKLVLSPGAAPIRPDMPGVDLVGVWTLRDVGDAERIKRRVDAGVRRAVIVGGGYIGLEMVENLVRRGVATTLIQSRDRLLTVLDPEMSTPIAAEVRRHGVDLVLDEEIVGFERQGGSDGLVVVGQSGRRFEADLVVVGVGVRPETGLAEASGLGLGSTGAIRVNPQMQTDDPDIYAIGDAVEVLDPILGGPTWVALAGPASRQSRVVAAHLLGRSDVAYRGSQGTIIVGVFGLTAGATGAGEAALRRVGRVFRSVYLHGNGHSGYIPGAEKITLKVLFDPKGGQVLGAQAVGGAGTDKRIDVLALAIQAQMTVFNLAEAELAYAPQYGAANDLVNKAGFNAVELIEGEHPQVDVADLPERVAAGAFVLDVRRPDEVAQDTFPGATNIPLDDLRDRLAEVPSGRPIVTVDSLGKRSYIATRFLLQRGRDTATLNGGMKTYRLFHPRESR